MQKAATREGHKQPQRASALRPLAPPFRLPAEHARRALPHGLEREAEELVPPLRPRACQPFPTDGAQVAEVRAVQPWPGPLADDARAEQAGVDEGREGGDGLEGRVSVAGGEEGAGGAREGEGGGGGGAEGPEVGVLCREGFEDVEEEVLEQEFGEVLVEQLAACGG